MDARERERRRRERYGLFALVGVLTAIAAAVPYGVPFVRCLLPEHPVAGWTVEDVQNRYAEQLDALRDYAQLFDEYRGVDSAPTAARELQEEAAPVFAIEGVLVAHLGCWEEHRGLTVYTSRGATSSIAFPVTSSGGPVVYRPSLTLYQEDEERYLSYEERLVDRDGRDIRIRLEVQP